MKISDVQKRLQEIRGWFRDEDVEVYVAVGGLGGVPLTGVNIGHRIWTGDDNPPEGAPLREHCVLLRYYDEIKELDPEIKKKFLEFKPPYEKPTSTGIDNEAGICTNGSWAHKQQRSDTFRDSTGILSTCQSFGMIPEHYTIRTVGSANL